MAEEYPYSDYSGPCIQTGMSRLKMQWDIGRGMPLTGSWMSIPWISIPYLGCVFLSVVKYSAIVPLWSIVVSLQHGAL